MRIQYLATGHQREVADGVGSRLVSRRIARQVNQARTAEPRPLRVASTERVAEASAATGKPKRRYRRRDIRVAD